MSRRFPEVIGVAAVILAVAVLLKLTALPVAAQAATTTAKTGAAAKVGPAPKTPWGEPDLQGIWTDEREIPLQRPAQYANRAFLTDAEIAALDKQRAKSKRANRTRPKRGTVQDVAGAYDSVFNTLKHTGRRTSLIVDPPDGRIPPFTPEAEERRDAIREFEVALLQATDICKNNLAECAGGNYGPASPRRAEPSPFYGGTGFRNRANGPEDRSLGERCVGGALPEFSNVNGFFRRIVQAPGVVSMFHDSGQGQGWHRSIPVTGGPHLPQHIRQWWGDSRGLWEGNTLVIDVTNFTAKTDFQGSRENLHLVERFTRLDANTLEYVVTVEDPTTWTRPWTVKQELTKQSDQTNRVYYEPRCHEGNYGMAGLLIGARADERAFTEGRGPDPATICIGNCGNGFTDDPQ